VCIKKIAVSAFMCFIIAVTCAFAQDGAAAQGAPAQPAAAQPAPEQAPVAAAAVDDDTEKAAASNIPATSYWGVRGLSQTVSAEPMGTGRLNISVFGSYFEQDQDLGVSGAPDKGAGIFLGRAALSGGLNSWFDGFLLLPMNMNGDKEFAVGEIVGGIQASLTPFLLPEDFPLKLAAQLHFIYGFTKPENMITRDSNYIYRNLDDSEDDSYAGYDFFDTRARGSFDVIAKLAQSLVFKDLSVIKFHFNEGIAFTPGGDWDNLLLLAAGLELDPFKWLTLGIEGNWRTKLKKEVSSDPFWITPSLMVRTPWNFGILGGCDVRALIKEDKTTKPLQAWRAFGEVVFSFDVLASKREAEARRARAEAAEKARLEAEAQRLAAEKEMLAQKAVEDSIRAAEEMARRAEADSIRAKAVADSLANLMDAISQKAKEDSLAMAASLADAEAKRVADSIALAQEKAKRSEAEQYLLTTGMLVLDAVYFTTGKADLHINSKPYLGTIAKMLVKYPKLKIEIGGHTDNIGRYETNINLSQRRAEAVYLLMVNTEPSLSQMLTSRGYGPSVPKADNRTAGGREVNRRVELKVLNPEVLKDYNPK